MPVLVKKLALNANQYYKKTDVKAGLCYCCLESVDSKKDMGEDIAMGEIGAMDKYVNRIDEE